jgi:ABC-type uncharacterized transport system involved in gliding motility auxiliary subunit
MSYDPHPVTERLSFTFFPGVRPLAISAADRTVSTVPLIVTSDRARSEMLVHSHDADHDQQHADGHAHAHAAQTGPRIIAAASSGTLSAAAAAPFRLIVVGDSDFASNSFYPYMSNSRRTLAMVRWLAHEDASATLAPQASVTSVELSHTEQRAMFLSLVIALPSTVALLGFIVWWRRR